MYAKQERVGDNLAEPHAILTSLGWLASGGRSDRSDRSTKIFTTNLKEDFSNTSSLNRTIVDKDKHIAELKSLIKDLAMKDELPQPTPSDLRARKLVECYVKLKSNRFEIPVPLKNVGIFAMSQMSSRNAERHLQRHTVSKKTASTISPLPDIPPL